MRKLYYLKFCQLLLLSLAVGISHHAHAQNTLITGRITSSDGGEGLPGVNIVVKGTTEGTITDVDGKYSIAVPSRETVLLFSYIGHLSQEINVGERTIIDIVLISDVKTLGEVVVVGYGTQEKVNVTGAVGSVKFDEKISSRALSNVTSGLSGLIPGLTAVQSSGMAGNNQATLLIRGLGSVNNSSPLVVVDGMPDVDINRLNFNDIESISVLKDAASASVYGSRGANGVILVTTKSGRGQQKTSINYAGSYAIEEPVKAYDFMADYPRALTIHQRAAAVNTLPQNYQFKNGTIDQWMAMSLIDPLRYPNTDWWNVIMRQGRIANHTVSATGGNNKSNFFISAGLMDQKGIQINNDFTRYNARFNYDYKLRDNMNTGIKFNGNWSKFTFSLPDGFTDSNPTNTGGFDLQFAIAGITPYDPATGYYGGVMAYGEAAQAYNPYTSFVNNFTRQNRQEVNPNLYFDWTPVKGLKGRIDYTLNYYNQFSYSAPIPNTAYNFQTQSFGSRIYVGDNAGISNTTNTGYKTQVNGRIEYNTVLANNHKISALAVYSEEYWYDRSQSSQRNDRLHPSLTEIDAALTSIQNTGGNSSAEGLRSYIGRVNYTAFEKYLFEASFRYDGSSKFLPGYQYGFFPSASVGWRFTEESFMASLGWLTNGKLRASYGALGNNSGVGRTEQQSTLAAGHYMVDGNIAKGFVNRKVLNKDVSWESTQVMNIGLELGFLNNRLTAEVDYYDRLTNGMLLRSQMTTLLTGAYDAPRTNIGDLRNRGVEGNFTWRDKMGAVSYTVSLNASYNANIIEKWIGFLGRAATFSPQAGVDNLVFLNMPYNYLYTYEDRGIAQTWQDAYNATPQGVSNTTPQGASPGDILRNDLNGDGQIDGNDRRAYPEISRDRPTTNFGMNISVAYKGFDLNLLAQGAMGRKDHWLNNYNNVNIGAQRYASTWNHWNNPWSVENRNRAWPRLNGIGNREETTFWLDDLSYLRMKNIQVGYSLPPKMLNKVRINTLRVYVSAENLATLTSYRGLDPEKTGNRSDAFPINKSYSFGINIGI
jgi:TonB-dependent starch-binding outer membrane protein SusC